MKLLLLVQSLSQGQIQGLCNFIDPFSSNNGVLQPGLLLSLVRKMSLADLERIAADASQKYFISQRGDDKEYEGSNQDDYSDTMSDISKDENLQLTYLYHLHSLQELLFDLPVSCLMKLMEILPSGQDLRLLQIQQLEQIQQLLTQLDPDTLKALKKELSLVPPGTEQQALVQMVQLESEHFHLYRALCLLLQLEEPDLLHLQQALPRFSFLQLIQITRLIDVGLFDVLDLRRLLLPQDMVADGYVPMEQPVLHPNSAAAAAVPEYTDPLEIALNDGSDVRMADEDSTNKNQSSFGLTLEIVEQPPEKCVYKRNIKPPPTVMVVGDESANDGNIYVAASLTRCDTGEHEPNLITGNKPVKVTSGRVIPFKRLKILVTSHQMNETLFSLRFELRRYYGKGEGDYEVLQTLASNPICVLSHSTQLKPTSNVAPVVLEVVPMSGPPSGYTRVVVLGANFVESPTTRVKFDNIEVMPIFHGPKTLICHTPRHSPGIVEVKVCNDAKKYSETFATFKYDDSLAVDDGKATASGDQTFRSSNSGNWEAAFEGGVETARVVQTQPNTGMSPLLPLRDGANKLDTNRGYAALHRDKTFV